MFVLGEVVHASLPLYRLVPLNGDDQPTLVDFAARLGGVPRGSLSCLPECLAEKVRLSLFVGAYRNCVAFPVKRLGEQIQPQLLRCVVVIVDDGVELLAIFVDEVRRKYFLKSTPQREKAEALRRNTAPAMINRCPSEVGS